MAVCEICDNKFGVFSRRVKRGDTLLCPGCVMEYEVRQSMAIIDLLYSDGDPEEYVLLTRVKANNIEKKQGRWQVRGALALTNKGMVFLEISRFHPGKHFAAVSSQLEEMAQREYDMAAVAVLDTSIYLKEMLEKAPRLFYYPIGQIEKMKCSGWGQKVLRFSFDRKKITFRLDLLLDEDEDIINRYTTMVNEQPGV